jgi:hypothetical protein
MKYASQQMFGYWHWDQRSLLSRIIPRKAFEVGHKRHNSGTWKLVELTTANITSSGSVVFLSASSVSNGRVVMVAACKECSSSPLTTTPPCDKSPRVIFGAHFAFCILCYLRHSTNRTHTRLQAREHTPVCKPCKRENTRLDASPWQQ